jgi:hypothetical protein
MAGSLEGLYVTIQFQTAGTGAVQQANTQLAATSTSARKAKTQLGGLNEILNRSHVAFASLTFMMNRLAREFNRGFVDSVDSVLTFQEAMSDVQRTTELSGRSLHKLRDSILRVSNATGTTATEISTIYKELGRQSSLLSDLTEEELVGAYDALGEKFAQFVGVGDVTLEFAMEKVPRIANLFKRNFGGDIVDAMEGSMDIMSALSHSIAGTSEDIIYYSSLMAAGAERFNWSLHETAAMSSMFIQMNKRAQRSGSAFQKMFNTMTNQAVNNLFKARTGIEATHEELIAAVLGFSDLKAFRRMIKTPEEAIGMLYELRDRVMLLADRTDMLPEQVMSLLGFEGVRLQDITGAMLDRENFETEFRRLVEISKDSAGDVEDRFSVYMMNVKKQWERMRNIIKNTIVGTYQDVADALTPVIQKINAFLIAYMKTNPKVVQLALALSFSISLFFTLGTALSGVLFLISMFGKSLLLAGAIMSGVVVVFIVGAATAWAAWEKYGQNFKQMFSKLSKHPDKLMDSLNLQGDRVWKLTILYKELGNVVLDYIERVIKFISDYGTTLEALFVDPIRNAMASFKAIAASVFNIFSAFFTETSFLRSVFMGIATGLYAIKKLLQGVAWVMTKVIEPFAMWLLQILEAAKFFHILGTWVGFYLTLLIAIKIATLAFGALRVLLLPFVFIWRAIAAAIATTKAILIATKAILIAIKVSWAAIVALINSANASLLLVPMLVLGVFLGVLWLVIKFTELVGLTDDWWKDLDRIRAAIGNIDMNGLINSAKNWVLELGKALTTWRGIAKMALYANPITLGVMVAAGRGPEMFLGPDPRPKQRDFTTTLGTQNRSPGVSEGLARMGLGEAERFGDRIMRVMEVGAEGRIPAIGELTRMGPREVMEVRPERLAERSGRSRDDYETVIRRTSDPTTIRQDEIILPLTVNLDGEVIYEVVEGVRLRRDRGNGASPLDTSALPSDIRMLTGGQ